VADRLAAAKKLRELPQGRSGARRPAKLLLPDTGEAQDRFWNGPPGIDEALEGRADAIGREGDGADLDHSVPGRVETGRLEVESCVFRQSRSRFYGRGGHNRGTPPESLAL